MTFAEEVRAVAEEFAEVARRAGKVVRKHPWMLSPPLFAVWVGTTTREERYELIRNALAEDGSATDRT